MPSILIAGFLSVAAIAQAPRNSPPEGPTPHTADGKPDLSKVWNPGVTFFQMGQVPLQPWAVPLYKDRRAALSKDDPFFLDGRGHSEDAGPTWMGDSIAHWDGDTLVVDTIGFNDKTWLNGQGLPHSDALHVIERYRRPDLGHLEIESTMEDPKAFTRPYTFKRTHTLMTNWEIHEYICNEFNVDAEHLVGK